MKVRDALERLRVDGLVLKRTRGDHRIFEHPISKRTVIIAGHDGDDIPAGTWNAIQRQAGWK